MYKRQLRDDLVCSVLEFDVRVGGGGAALGVQVGQDFACVEPVGDDLHRLRFEFKDGAYPVSYTHLGCDCAAGMSAMLQLLCDPRIAPLVDYSQFAFFTRNFVLGTSLDCPATSTAGYDNLTGPLAGSFERIRSCSCENLEVSGQIYYCLLYTSARRNVRAGQLYARPLPTWCGVRRTSWQSF